MASYDVSCPRRQVVDPFAAPDRRSGRLARADGGLGVVANVVETPWTGSATGDAMRRRGAESSAAAGLNRRDEAVWTRAGCLITQRSRVQIPPPPPSSEAGSEQGTGLSLVVCARICARACFGSRSGSPELSQMCDTSVPLD